MFLKYLFCFSAICLTVLLMSHEQGWADYVIQGEFDSASPTYDRTKSTDRSVEPECGLGAEDSTNDAVAFSDYKFVSTYTGYIGASVENGTVDTMLAIYCYSFDPDNPEDEILAMDDDSNGWPNPSLNSRYVWLEEGDTYHLVVVNYSNFTPSGTFELVVSDGLRHVHTLADAISGLQVLAGMGPPGSRLSHLSDLAVGGKITLETVITVLKELVSEPL